MSNRDRVLRALRPPRRRPLGDRARAELESALADLEMIVEATQPH